MPVVIATQHPASDAAWQTYPSVEGGCKLHVSSVLFTAIGSQLLSQVSHLLQLVTGVTNANAV